MHLSIFNFRKVFKIISYFIVVIVCMSIASGCFSVVSTKSSMYYFYQLKNMPLDVINIGSSHVLCSINPLEMYRRKGITAYNLADGSQPVWFSYYYLKEALKSQSPQVVLLDVYMLYQLDDSAFIEKTQMNILQMKPSLNKLEAIESNEVSDKDRWGIFWGFPKIHARYRELGVEKYYEAVSENMMGYSYLPSSDPKNNEEVLDATMVTEVLPVSEKAEYYLRKSIELCKTEGIEIVLVNSPWAGITYDAACRYNYVQEIADEYEIDFLDGTEIYKEIGINYLEDNAEGEHLCYTGSLKWTDYLLEYLTERYELPDHRGEYMMWEEAIEVLDNLLAVEELKKSTNAEEYFQYLVEETQLPYVAIIQSEDGMREGLEIVKESGLELEGEERGYILRTPEGKVRIRNGLYGDKRLYKEIYDDLQEGLKGEYNNILMQYTEKIADARTTEGICYVVFDPFSYELLDVVEFGEKNDYYREK